MANRETKARGRKGARTAPPPKRDIPLPPNEAPAPDAAGPQAPTPRELVPGLTLLALFLGVGAAWFWMHLGGVAAALFAGVPTIGGWLLSGLTAEAQAEAQGAFTRSLTSRTGKRTLAAALAVEVAVGCTVTSTVVTWDGSADGAAVLLRTGDGADADGVLLTPQEPVWLPGLAFTQVPPLNSAEYRLKEGRRRPPFFPGTLRYPSDFQRRATLLLLPYDALYYAMQDQAYRVRVRNAAGAALVDTVFGGAAGPRSVWVGGAPAGAFEAVLARNLGTGDLLDGNLQRQAVQWRKHVQVQPAAPLALGDRLTVEVWHLGRPDSLLLRQAVQLADTVHPVFLTPP